MTSIPSGSKFLSVISSVDTTQKRSQSINEESQFYTIEEIATSVKDNILPTYKVYTALLSQTGTNAPTAWVLQNTFDNDFVWNYVDTGTYSVSNNEITWDAVVFFGANEGTGLIITSIEKGNHLITTISTDIFGEISNHPWSNYPIEIRVYL